MTKKNEKKKTVQETLDTAIELLDIQAQIYELRKQLDNKLVENHLSKGIDLFNPYSANSLCYVNNNYSDVIFKEVVTKYKGLAINVLKDCCNERQQQRKRAITAINSLLDNPDELFDIAANEGQQFTNDQTKYLWDNHGQYIFNKIKLAPNKLIVFCHMFKNFIQYEHKELLVKRICGRKDEHKAKELKKDKDIDLPQDLIDQLDGMLMLKKLIS